MRRLMGIPDFYNDCVPWNSKVYRVSQNKCGSDFSSHYWHKYFTHMRNKERYGILINSAFHAIFCFYPTPFQSLAIILQSTSPPKSNTLFWSTAYVHNACVMCWIQLSWKLRGWFIDKWGPLKWINKGVGSHTD